MGYFIAYRHTGADPKQLEELLPVVYDTLKKRGNDVYCTYFDGTGFKPGHKPRQAIEHAFAKIEQLGALFVILDSDEKSEGMLMEIGYCLARHITMIVAKRASVKNSYVQNMADHSFEYTSINDLKQKILAAENIWR